MKPTNNRRTTKQNANESKDVIILETPKAKPIEEIIIEDSDGSSIIVKKNSERKTRNLQKNSTLKRKRKSLEQKDGNSANLENVDVILLSEEEEDTYPSARKRRKSAEKSSRVTKHILNSENLPHRQTSNQWKYEDIIAKSVDTDVKTVKIVKNLLDNDCTVPFIARYRQLQTNNIDVKKIIEIEEEYKILKDVKKKSMNAISKLSVTNSLTEELESSLNHSINLDQINFLMAPFKSSMARSHASRAIEKGLLPQAMKLLNTNSNISDLEPKKFVNAAKGLKSVDDVLQNWHYIIADAISKDPAIIEEVKKLVEHQSILLQTSKIEGKGAKNKDVKNIKDDAEKYSFYYKYESPIKFLRSHNVLAVNRGEKDKKLKVTVWFPAFIESHLKTIARRTWTLPDSRNSDTDVFLYKCIEDSYKRLIKPYAVRLIRSNLTKVAEKESIDVFKENLYNLLLTPPIEKQPVIAIDPGFTNGCKVAVTSPFGDILDASKIFINSTSEALLKVAESCLISLISKYNCKVIAIGNGQGCRQTEEFVASIIEGNRCRWGNSVQYCIVNEEGVSVYSVSEIATKEMENIDPTLRSAVSLCRRLQDPLSEYIKVAPKHLGVGMYQHDISTRNLDTALDNVVIRCVSFVGVDLNTSSELMLTKVAGLNATKAKNILEWRKTNGSFQNRNQLKKVKGIGPKCFEQCAGFVKIDPKTCRDNRSSSEKRKEFNPLDVTTIHPEVYHQTERLLEFMNATSVEIGSTEFINKLNKFVSQTSLEECGSLLKLDSFTLQNIIDNLKRPTFDIRSSNSKPLFRKGLSKMEDLEVGMQILGKVMNVTHFGAFVDIGVGKSGLIHNSKMQGNVVKVGDLVTVQVLCIQKPNKIGLVFASLA